MIFDLFSSEYGWTTDQIRKMTRREVNWRITAINERKIAEMKFQAGLAGKKIEGDPVSANEVPAKAREFTKDELARIEKARKETFSKKVRELSNG